MHDIFYISNQPHVDGQYAYLKNKFINIKTAASLFDAQKKSLTSFFWIIWDDVIVDETFDFSYEPDSGSRTYIHVFLNNDTYDGIVLIPKDAEISTREHEHRFFINKKEVAILASSPKPYDKFYIESYEDYLEAINSSTTNLFWMLTHNVAPYHKILDNFYITHHDNYLKKQNHAFLNETDDGSDSYGIYLLTKDKLVSKKEIEFKHIVEVEKTNIIASSKTKYDMFVIDSYDDYKYAYANSKTEMFWGTSNNFQLNEQYQFDMYFSFDNFYDRHENHAFIHRVNGTDFYNGVFLFSKRKLVTQPEIEMRHLATRKEWNIVASGPKKYEIFKINSYEDYEIAYDTSKTEMFWSIPSNIILDNNFDFSLYFNHIQEFERTHAHAFLNGDHYDGVVLCTKHTKITKREFDYGFIANKVETGILASTPKPFDVVFISFDEENAEENYKKLMEKRPDAKRVHKVVGIHQAHIAAANLCTTEMFWIVDGDAVIADDFDFSYQPPKWEFNTVHVWRSKNPINGLTYGYGGVKLFPRKLTIDMDTSLPDMTTSISKNFKPMHQVSNITQFNTSPFGAWKSAFRECVKLSSKIISRQKDAETVERLSIWKTVGADAPFGQYALTGASMGTKYGEDYRNDIEQLKKINDFAWLKEVFNDTFK